MWCLWTTCSLIECRPCFEECGLEADKFDHGRSIMRLVEFYKQNQIKILVCALIVLVIILIIALICGGGVES